ncbi:MFS transporter [Arenibaculum pallidiluteum]|uniref:MFS transporter n=1 Tax=Arenibaculum pallidiluteum TaxID=2812559 RepID=UPI001A960B87|nr:MFS transporter [Arenibaculum pallidiluteum]
MTVDPARLSIGFSCLGHAVMHVLTALYLTIVLGLERDWAIGYDTLISLWTVGAVLVGLGAPLAGWLGDRWGDARMMVVFFVLTGAGAILAARAEGTGELMVALAVLGLGASIYHPVGMSWLVKVATNRGRAMGVLGIFGSLGIAMAAVIAGALMDWRDWRAAFWVPGAVSLACGAALLVCMAAGLVIGGADGARGAKHTAAPSRGDLIRAFVVLSVTMVCNGLVFQSTMTAMPKWFGETMTGLAGGGLLGIGGLVTVVYLFASVSQLLGGVLCDRYPLKRVYVACLLLQVPLLLVAAGLTGLPLLVVATVMVFAGSLQIPAENLLLARYTPARHQGLAYGLKFVLSFGASPLGVLMVAAVYDRFQSFYWLFMLLGGLAALAFVAACLLPREPRAEPAAAAIPAAAE